jgi:polysaccharide biosynthesis protein PslA
VALRDDRSVYGADSGTALHNTMPALRVSHAAKRLADIAVATIGLVLFSPLLFIACVAIKLDSPGPVLVRVKRYGYKNRPVQVLKFRLVDVRTKSGRGRLPLTRVGRLLSQTGVDELPRLVNVLRGELSIVGPPPSTHPKMSLNRAKPGMIQWAQIIAIRELPPHADRD